MAIKTKKEKSKVKKSTVVKTKPKVKKAAEKKAVVRTKQVAKPKASPKIKPKAAVVKKETPVVSKPTVVTVAAPLPQAKPILQAKPIPQVKPAPQVKPIQPPLKEIIHPKPVITKVSPPVTPAVKPKPTPPPVKPKPIIKETPVAAPVLQPVVVKELKGLELELPVNIKDLALKLQEKPSVLIKMLMGMRLMVGINQALDETTVKIICEKFGCKIKPAPSEEELALRIHQEPDKLGLLQPRPPVVTFMGHVDHGKTSLLDAIRKTKVAEGEHGGITQHIGAYRVHLSHGDITFLDTPGHEAFTAMRARGARITDIVVLVVAADDGIMPQTKEAIDHARAAGVSIIIAINKIDKPQADIDRVKKQLSEMNLSAEDWGGKTITVPVSAKTGQGIDNLLEMIILESQMLELKANPKRLARGVVVEAKMSKGKGPVATLLVQNGTLHTHENIIVGSLYGKIRAMFNHLGQLVKEAPPAYPVEVLGLSNVPAAGDQFFVIEDERIAKEVVALRLEKEKESQIRQIKHISLEDLYSQIKEGKLKELKLIIKADVQGSLAAIKDTLNKINSSEIKLEVIHEGVGNINSSDVILAVASDALVLGFNVIQDNLAKELSTKEGVDVRIYNIIYELANDIKAALEGMLEPKLKKVFLGRAEVKKVFKLSRSGIVAGCIVAKGKIIRSAAVSLVRNAEIVFEGSIADLKRFKDDVREVAEGFECGISLKGFDNLQEGDIIEAYEIEKIARKL